MNLWGFCAAMRARFVAVATTHNFTTCGEARLPDVVEAAMLDGARFSVLLSEDLCVGVTHYSDLEIAQSLLGDAAATLRAVTALST
jgi:hypothetical protein